MSPNYTQNFPTVSRGRGQSGGTLLKSSGSGKKEEKRGVFLRRQDFFSKKDWIVDGEVTEVLLLAQAGGGPGEDWVPASSSGSGGGTALGRGWDTL